MSSPGKTAGSGAALRVVASAMLWGTYGSFVNLLHARGLADHPLMFLRFLFTCLPILCLILVRDRGQLAVKREDAWLFLANGLASVVFFTTCYTAAVQVMKIATAAALLYTSPAIVMLCSVLLFREKLTARKVLCVLVSILGCALVSGLAGGGLGLTTRGILLGLGSALGYALYSIFSRCIQDRGYSIFTNVFYTFSVATVVYLVCSIREGSAVQMLQLPGTTLLAVLCGLLTGAMAYGLYTAGLAGMEPSRAAQIATIEPVTAAVLGTILFHQTLAPVELLGIALVVGSVIVMNTGETGSK